MFTFIIILIKFRHSRIFQKSQLGMGRLPIPREQKKLGTGDTVNLADIVIKRSCLSPTSVP